MVESVWSFLLFAASVSNNALQDHSNTPLALCRKPILVQNICKYEPPKLSLEEIKSMLQKKATSMRQPVKQKVLLALKCAKEFGKEHNHIITVIDFSLPSSQKRLWVFNLNTRELLFHTYVSHGIKSGEMYSSFFSNRNNSKASSVGVFKTEQAYYGRHGRALRLAGLEQNFNHNAASRAIVMHGGWYVEEPFIKKYGRAGRSWGCPAIPNTLTRNLIDTIKEDNLFIAYYPSEQWAMHSRYLHCDRFSHFTPREKLRASDIEPEENRDPILFVEKNNNNSREENEPIIAMRADDYQSIFNDKAPLKRMLRRQINQAEYVALNREEFATLIKNRAVSAAISPESSSGEIFFIIPEVKKVRGYYATEMKILNLGTIKEIVENGDSTSDTSSPVEYIIHFETKPSAQLKSTDQFIRWLGL